MLTPCEEALRSERERLQQAEKLNGELLRMLQTERMRLLCAVSGLNWIKGFVEIADGPINKQGRELLSTRVTDTLAQITPLTVEEAR